MICYLYLGSEESLLKRQSSEVLTFPSFVTLSQMLLIIQGLTKSYVYLIVATTMATAKTFGESYMTCSRI